MSVHFSHYMHLTPVLGLNKESCMISWTFHKINVLGTFSSSICYFIKYLSSGKLPLNDSYINFLAIEEVVNSLDDPSTAGLILEEQAKSLKSILADPSIQHLIKVYVYFIINEALSVWLW